MATRCASLGTYLQRRGKEERQAREKALVRQGVVDASVWLENPLFLAANHLQLACGWWQLCQWLPASRKALEELELIKDNAKGKENLSIYQAWLLNVPKDSMDLAGEKADWRLFCPLRHSDKWMSVVKNFWESSKIHRRVPTSFEYHIFVFMHLLTGKGTCAPASEGWVLSFLIFPFHCFIRESQISISYDPFLNYSPCILQWDYCNPF